MPLPIRVTKLRRGDRERLQRVERARTTPHRVVERVRIVLASADGLSGNAICEKEGGVEALLQDRPRPGRPREISVAEEEAMIKKTLETKPPNGTHWSTRIMAKEVGWDPTTVSRIWRAHGIKPHRVRTFKLSKDPQFIEKLRAVVGLYMKPPQRAVVFSGDEKSQIQALDRTQPGLPLKKGRAGTMTHDYKRHGTTTLFAALDVKTGSVIHECMPRHRAAEFLRFARKVVRSVPRGLDVYFILDNYATHKTPEVMAWLEKNPRVSFYFVPKSASWVNLVERLFSELTERQLRRLVVHNVDELIEAISTYLDRRNEDPKPFVWTATVQSILAKVEKAKKTLATLR
jgi:transposase